MLPLVGVNSVVSILIVVVFPAPLGPRNAKISPAFTSSEMSSTADTSPYFFTRLVMRIMCGRMLQIRGADFQRNVLLKADATSIALARACRDQCVHGIRVVERPDCSECFCRLRCGQRALDIDETHRQSVLAVLRSQKAPHHLVQAVEEVIEFDEEEKSEMFGESLPIGLRLVPNE